MAIGTYTLAQLVDMTRTRIQAYTHEIVAETEIEEELNVQQYNIFMLMHFDLKKFHYGDVAELSLSQDATTDYYAAAKPATFWDVITVKHYWQENGDNYRQDLDKVDMESLEEIITNTFYEEEAYCLHGAKVYTTFSAAPAGTVIMLFIRQPVKMDSGNNLDLPDPFVGLLVAQAAASFVATMELPEGVKQVALQMFELQARTAREVAGLPSQSEKEEREILSAAGIPGETPPPPPWKSKGLKIEGI